MKLYHKYFFAFTFPTIGLIIYLIINSFFEIYNPLFIIILLVFLAALGGYYGENMNKDSVRKSLNDFLVLNTFIKITAACLIIIGIVVFLLSILTKDLTI